MARRRRRRNPLAAFGYPGMHRLTQQALALAQAGAPTQRSIRHEYGQQMSDVQGFTNALVSLLQRDSHHAGQPFGDAIHQQRSIDQAAQDRLAELGPEYANLAGATAEGPLSGLIDQRASARSYAAKQPAIAARAGTLQATGIADARTEALRQRQEGIQQALPAIFNTLQQQAIANAQANRSFREGKHEFRAGQASQAAQLTEQQREFDIEQKRLRDQFIADQKAAIAKSPYTPSQISSFRATTSQQVVNAINAGVGPQQFINDAVQRGIPREVAAQSAAYAYGRLADRIGRLGNRPQFAAQNPKRAHALDAYEHWVAQLHHMYGGKKKRRPRGFNPGR